MNFTIIFSFLLLLVTGSQSYLLPSPYSRKNILRLSSTPDSSPCSINHNDNVMNFNSNDLFDLSWYVIGKPSDFSVNKPNKIRIWNTDYVVWRNKEGKYIGLDNVCSHRGASMANGKICRGNIVCPYHAYEFNETGNLSKIPGIRFKPTPIHNLASFVVAEHNNWVYLNIQKLNSTEFAIRTQQVPSFSEPEIDSKFSLVHLNMDFNCNSRVLSENSLDVMHIAFVHTFGNARRPNPTYEIPPRCIGTNHYKTTYFYEAGEQSVARKVFGIKDLIIENEFILPHTTVARVIFGSFISTVVTFALPTGDNTSKLFVKTYRNFWQNSVGDIFTRNMMLTTILQDKSVIETIDSRYMNGKFNMRFDKLQNTYISLYNKFVRNFSKKNM